MSKKASIYGHPDMLKWAVEKGFPVTDMCMKGALQEGYHDIAEFSFLNSFFLIVKLFDIIVELVQ